MSHESISYGRTEKGQYKASAVLVLYYVLCTMFSNSRYLTIRYSRRLDALPVVGLEVPVSRPFNVLRHFERVFNSENRNRSFLRCSWLFNTEKS